MVEEITWEEIYPIWSNYLWPGRPNIKPYTPMINATELDLTIHKRAADKWMYYHGIFFGIRDNAGKIIGVNSGHQCSNILFRSRVLYVTPEHTGKGLAQALLKHTIEFAREKEFKKIWSYPRARTIKTYSAVGYICDNPAEHESYEKEDGTIVYRDNAYAELIL